MREAAGKVACGNPPVLFFVRLPHDQSYALPSTGKLLLASNTIMRIKQGPYFADVLRDARVHFDLWHWIVQREGSQEISGMGQERTEEEARKSAEQCIADLRRNSQQKRAAG